MIGIGLVQGEITPLTLKRMLPGAIILPEVVPVILEVPKYENDEILFNFFVYISLLRELNSCHESSLQVDPKSKINGVVGPLHYSQSNLST